MLNTMKRRLKELADMGPKPSGSIANTCARHYIMSELQAKSSLAHEESFSFEGWRNLGESTLRITSPYGKSLNALPFLGSASGHFRGELRKIGLNHVWNIYNWDRYAVFDRGELVAHISGRPDGGLLSQTLVEGNSPWPHLIVDEADNRKLCSLLNDGVKVELEGNATCEPVAQMQGINIVVPFKASDPIGGPVVITAHRDTMYNTPGAYDNQSGTVVLMALSDYLSEYGCERDYTLIFTDGEECRLAGSRYAAKHLARENVEYMINIDGIGRGDELEIWSGPITFEARVMRKLLNDPALPVQCYRNPPPLGSDHSPFYEKGIPCVMLTFNDQDIIHTPRDCYNERLVHNMEKMFNTVLKLMTSRGGIL